MAIIPLPFELPNKEFQSISICTLLDHLGYDYRIHSYEDETKMVLNWCMMNNFYLYERSREDFSEFEGIDIAQKTRYAGVVFSDLS